jgi:hypothetical protein
MITDPNVAEQINSLMLDLTSRINESVATVQMRCPETEFKTYRLAAGKVLGEILLEVLNPLHELHPRLRLPDLRG